MKLTVELDGTLLGRRQVEWAHHLAHSAENPLSTRASFAGGEVLLENELCVYSQDSRYSDGLPHSGFIVTRRPCETVFDLTPAEAAATHALLAEVKAHLDTTVQPDGYTVGWNVYPAGGAHIPHVHLHIIPRWNTDASAGVGLRWFLRQVAGERPRIRPAGADDMPAIHDLILQAGLSEDRAKITATLEGCSYWVAARNGELIGCIGLEHGNGASLLRSACVAPEQQGRGIGAGLAATALGAARGRGERAVYLFSSHAGAYWQRLGFVQVPVSELSAALPGVPQVRSGECRGWIHSETAWRLDLSGKISTLPPQKRANWQCYTSHPGGIPMTDEHTKIRAVTPADYRSVLKVMQDAGLETDGVMVLGTTYWLMEKDGQPVGAIGLEHGDGVSLLRGAAVSPTARGQGLGRALVMSAVTHAQMRGDRAIYMFSTGGDWESFGFTQVPLAIVLADIPDAPQVTHYRASASRPGGTTWMRTLS